jgi:zinc transporter ZupT
MNEPILTGIILHFTVSLIIVLGFRLFIFTRPPFASITSMFFTLSIGVMKELYDYVVNPWGMSVLELTKDSSYDMLSNVLGVVFGLFILSFRRIR